jgi:hypothetical protein
MKIEIASLPVAVADFHVGLTNYLLARVAHRLTEGQPAPFPDYEIYRMIAERIENGEKLEIVDTRDPVILNPPMPPTPADIAAAVAKRTLWERIIDVFNPLGVK